MQQTLPEKEGRPSWSLRSRMALRYPGGLKVSARVLLAVTLTLSSVFPQVFFVESVCEDPDVIQENIVVSVCVCWHCFDSLDAGLTPLLLLCFSK